ncbi:MAG: hypothetical protein LBH44_01730 [Treponema sp.]|jgi:hypothetical protein|nr:hypothetical protein [Treponema sp.]
MILFALRRFIFFHQHGYAVHLFGGVLAVLFCADGARNSFFNFEAVGNSDKIGWA